MPETTTPRRLAIIGTGRIGMAAGRLWIAAGHTVVFGSRHPQERAEEIAGLGERASVVLPAEAAAAGDIVLLAVPGETVDALVDEIAGLLAGKIVINATNQLAYIGGRWLSALEPGLTEGRRMARLLPGSTVVRAFSHVPDELLWPRGSEQATYWAMAVAADDEEAGEIVCSLVRDAGWVPVHLGGLDDSAALDPGGSVFHLFYSEAEMRDVVGLSSAAR
ncbi:NAD(P)-binding domain-containing protein [Streptomyces sp. NBC_01136]|uniref:NADPH-dependent F420 reductase n=1 Tax=unclassified Streptomyces TaxID=2593676 RepID=UPI00325670BB|nr:NAD(P)-binding domain-containing protein [Streptomyces sp. NBC_01136]